MTRPWLRRALRPFAWPIALKLWLTLLGVALVPMAATAWASVHEGMASIEQAESANITLLARSTAGRIDQLLIDSSRLVAQLSADVEVRAYLASDPASRAVHAASVGQALSTVTESNPDAAAVYLLDRQGTCVLSTDPDFVGQRYDYREYFVRATGPDAHVSELLTGSTSAKAGIYVSKAVRDGAGERVGVAVLKLRAEAVTSMVTEVSAGAAGMAMLVDGHGVVIAHRDQRLLYRSLAPLSDEAQAQPEIARRFSSLGIDHIESLGCAPLARTLLSARAPGYTSFDAPFDGTRHLAGYAPLATKGWAVVVHEPAWQRKAELAALSRKVWLSVLGVGGAVSLMAFLIARTITRPIRDLERATDNLERGVLDTTPPRAFADDELGRLAAAFATMLAGLRAREREREIFGRMVSPEVREKLLSGALSLGGETRRVAILFSDIRGFSTMSERLAPLEVVAMLNEYLTEMTTAARAFGGYVNNFIGDAIVVVFGAPADEHDVERRAVEAARAMRRRLEHLNERRRARGEEPLDSGIGIAVGDAVAGQIGSPERMLYTVIGDVVNVAARLESLTKDERRPILVTRAIADGLPTPYRLSLECLGPRHLKGRREPVEVYAVSPEPLQ